MNYNELSGGPLYKAVRQWLDNNPGKDLGDFAKETGYKGKPLKIKDPKTGRAGFDIGNTAADLVGLIPTPMTVAGSEAAQRALMMGQMTYNAQRQMQKQEQEGGKETMAGFDILNELEYIGNQLRNFKMPYRRFGGSYTPMKDR